MQINIPPELHVDHMIKLGAQKSSWASRRMPHKSKWPFLRLLAMPKEMMASRFSAPSCIADRPERSVQDS